MPTLKLFGFETEAPKWVLTLFALILVAGAGWTIYQKVYADPERVLITLKEANKQLASEIDEYSLHMMEEPQKHELFEDQDGRLMLRVFKDHCVLIQRQTARGTRTKLVMDLARAAAALQTEPTRSIYTSGAPRFTGEAYIPARTHFLTVEAAQNCQRGCLNPHPGPFRTWYGDQHGEWVEVWRQWPEGCTHFQMFNPRLRVWDSNPDGSARVTWRCCVH